MEAVSAIKGQSYLRWQRNSTFRTADAHRVNEVMVLEDATHLSHNRANGGRSQDAIGLLSAPMLVFLIVKRVLSSSTPFQARVPWDESWRKFIGLIFGPWHVLRRLSQGLCRICQTCKSFAVTTSDMWKKHMCL